MKQWDYAVALWLHKLKYWEQTPFPRTRKGLAKNPQQCGQARENSLLQEHPTGKQQFYVFSSFVEDIFPLLLLKFSVKVLFCTEVSCQIYFGGYRRNGLCCLRQQRSHNKEQQLKEAKAGKVRIQSDKHRKLSNHLIL